jgi:tRNA(Met) cytidine acetyltransferase
VESVPTVVSDQLINAAEALAALARRHCQRRALVLAGERDWGREAACEVLERLAPVAVHWFSDAAPPGASASQGSAALALLGGELDALVFDAWSGFDPDAFGALTGTLRGGGLLLLMTPPFQRWPQFPDPQNRRIAVAPYSAQQLSGRFLQRLVRVLESDPDVLRCEEGRPVRVPVDAVTPTTQRREPVAAPCRTADQQRAVDAVVRVVTGHRRRPVVLTSDRGRGKSAAFGIAAAQLIQAGRAHILVTGPRMRAAQAVLEHARSLLPKERHGAIAFRPPDELLRESPPADLLLVDEAAAIPAPLLEGLLRRYSRIAFATTVHGYEGTGRGFAIRFSQSLDRYSNGWKQLTLTAPIRWIDDDPLERLVFRMLLLDANAAPDRVLQGADVDSCTIERLDRDQLLADETRLSELFGLLVLAHYRTRPLDLRHLLDGPNLSIYALCLGRHVAATALVADEGSFDAATAQAIAAGRTRPHGHLLPETLAAHQGLAEAPGLRAARIMRIAVHPAVQRRGLGLTLVRHITREAAVAGYDYIGASFGASSELLEFWNRLGWLPVRLSIQAGASSGYHSVVLLQALSARGERLAGRARERFFAHFPHQLSDSLQNLEPELVCSVMRNGAHAVPLSDADWRDVEAFALQQRLAEVTIGALWRLGCVALEQGDALSALTAAERTLLVARVLQKRSWQECAALVDVPGRAAALALLRRAVAKLIRYHAD